MNIVFFGTPQFAVPSLERLITQPGFKVLAVVTQPDKKRGRGKHLLPSPIKQVAVTHDIPVWQPRRIKRDQATLAALGSLQADAFVVVAYGQILSSEILAMPRLGCINSHGSLLPKYRGAAPIQWCVYDGETETGITTMLMDEGMDTGAMLLKATMPIALTDDAIAVAQRLATISADLLVDTLTGLEQGQIQPIPQDNRAATYARLIQKEDYGLDWTKTAIALHNQVRAFYPNCTAVFRDQPLKIVTTLPLEEAAGAGLSNFAQLERIPGAIVGLIKNEGVIVQTGSGLLLLKAVQLPGKKVQSGWDFVNGSRLQVGEKIGSAQPNP